MPCLLYTSSDAENIVHTTIWIASIVASWKMQGIKIEHNLESVVDVAAFLEGYEPGAALPQTLSLIHISVYRGEVARLTAPSDKKEA